MPTPAQNLTRAIRDILALHGWMAFKVGAGMIRTQGRMVCLSTPGAPDLVAIKGPRYLLIEVKAGKDRLRESQEQFQQDVENVGGYYLVARSVDDVLIAIGAPAGGRN
jgi:Holliday junction resolvase